MGSQHLSIRERLLHLRMRNQGSTVKEIQNTTGNSIRSVYYTLERHRNSWPLVFPRALDVGRNRLLSAGDVAVSQLSLSSLCHMVLYLKALLCSF